MTINIKGTNIQLTQDLQEYIFEKFGQIDRYFPGVSPDGITADVEIGKPSQHHRKGDVYLCDITLSIGGITMHAEEYRETPHDAIDTVKDEIERQAKKMKAKRRDKFLRRARKSARELRMLKWFRRGNKQP